MAFTSTITSYAVFGDMKVSWGTWSTDTTGGDIDTGLNICKGITLTHNSDAAIADQPAINETLPVVGSAVTIVNTSAKGGNWMAWGY